MPRLRNRFLRAKDIDSRFDKVFVGRSDFGNYLELDVGMLYLCIPMTRIKHRQQAGTFMKTYLSFESMGALSPSELTDAILNGLNVMDRYDMLFAYPSKNTLTAADEILCRLYKLRRHIHATL